MPPHHHALIWFLYLSIATIALYISWDLNIVSTIYQADRSYLTSAIAVLIVFSTAYAAWHIISYSQQIETAKLHLLGNNSAIQEKTGLIENFLDESGVNTAANSRETHESYDAIVEIYADKLRSPVELGWFLVDLAIRLGLVGTIIGFILIFTSLSGSSITGTSLVGPSLQGPEGLKELLVTMSGGMGTALFTTLSGLVGATLLSVQFMVLGRQSEHLVGLILRLRHRNHHQFSY